MTEPVKRATGCLIGLALADSLGAGTEFLRSLDEIRFRYGDQGPQEPPKPVALVTDDTQMTISVAADLVAAPKPYAPDTLADYLVDNYLCWLQSPLNNRGPGTTCLQACHGLADGLPWVEASVVHSKGCGTVMRVAPVALVHGLSVRERAGIAQLTAAITHGHPTGLTAADLTAYAIHALIAGGDPQALPQRLRDYARRYASIYHAEWLGTLWERAGAASPAAYIGRGWAECLATLDTLDAALSWPRLVEDPADAAGEGWIAEECLGTALYAFLRHADDPVAAIRYAACSRGDSDTLAAVTAALAGAAHGLDVWPLAWRQRLESRDVLYAFGALWDTTG